MPSGRKMSFRTRLTLTILAAIFLSWILSAGLVVYLARREGRELHRVLQQHPGRATVREFIRDHPKLGQILSEIHRGRTTVLLLPFPIGRGAFVMRLAIALLLALIAGAWLSRRFSRPLAALEKGAQAFHAGEFAHRIPLEGDDEFTRVATAMNEMAGRVSEQITTLEEDAQRRKQLLADIAHELRSPAATLRAMAEAVRDGVADQPERRELALTTMVTTADRLQRLVNDLLELARLDLRELSLQLREVDLRALTAQCLHDHAEAAAHAGITLQPIEDDGPLFVQGDPHRLAQILDNLLDNAIAYAGEGAEVRITLQEGNPTVLTIADTGRGIPAEHLPFIFDAFYRIDQARTPGDIHSGLGLRIARALTEAHSGTLTLESEEGKGTRAIISLPSASSL
ncbi:MAG: sensor histidine kinase [Armatimonadota bacterium]